MKTVKISVSSRIWSEKKEEQKKANEFKGFEKVWRPQPDCTSYIFSRAKSALNPHLDDEFEHLGAGLVTCAQMQLNAKSSICQHHSGANLVRIQNES